MSGHAEDPDPAGGVLDDREDIGAGAVEQIDGEEVRRQDRLGLAMQELRPGRSGSPRRRRDRGVGQDLPHRRGCYLDAETGEFTMDPPGVDTRPRIIPSSGEWPKPGLRIADDVFGTHRVLPRMVSRDPSVYTTCGYRI